jgi:hypothetical protein
VSKASLVRCCSRLMRSRLNLHSSMALWASSVFRRAHSPPRTALCRNLFISTSSVCGMLSGCCVFTTAECFIHRCFCGAVDFGAFGTCHLWFSAANVSCVLSAHERWRAGEHLNGACNLYRILEYSSRQRVGSLTGIRTSDFPCSVRNVDRSLSRRKAETDIVDFCH